MARTSRERWRRRVEAWVESGLGCKEYAARSGVKATTLAWWKWKLGVDGSGEAPAAFVELTPGEFGLNAGSAADAGVELDVGGVVVRVRLGFDPVTLEQVVGVLARRT